MGIFSLVIENPSATSLMLEREVTSYRHPQTATPIVEVSAILIQKGPCVTMFPLINDILSGRSEAVSWMLCSYAVDA